MFGLTEQDIDAIVKILRKYKEVERAVIFGSRAKKTHRKGSDVDISVFGKDISFQTIRQLSYDLNEETLMPYHFDVLDYKSVENNDLKQHIERVGINIYTADLK